MLSWSLQLHLWHNPNHVWSCHADMWVGCSVIRDFQYPDISAGTRKEKGSGEKSFLLVASNLEIASCEQEQSHKTLCACLGILISISHLWAAAEFSFKLWHSSLLFVPIYILGSSQISLWPNLDHNSQGLSYDLCCNQIWEQMISVCWCWWELCPWKPESREIQMVQSPHGVGERSCAGRAVSTLLCWTIASANFFLCPLTQLTYTFLVGGMFGSHTYCSSDWQLAEVGGWFSWQKGFCLVLLSN